MSANTASIASAAGAIKAQWNGADTGKGMQRLAPRSVASAMARSIAAVAPDSTTWPGALSLAGWQTSPSAASAAKAEA